MNRTGIDWCDFTWNPVFGCKNNCSYTKEDGTQESYCYARKFAKRQKCEKCKTFTPHGHFERLTAPLHQKKPATIFLGSMCDLWGDWISSDWIKAVLNVVKQCPQHTFLALTKNPARYMEFDLPENMWCGVTVTGELGTSSRLTDLLLLNYRLTLDGALRDRGTRKQRLFLSAEPLLANPLDVAGTDLWNLNFNCRIKWLDQIIIGPLSHRQRVTTREMILNLTDLAVKANVPVFHKSECLKQGLLREEEMRKELAWVTMK